VIRTTITVRRAPGAVSALRSLGPAAEREIRALLRQFAEEIRTRTQNLAPIDTGFMREHVEVRYSDDGLTAFIGWWTDVFLAAGLAPYFVYQELGFRHHSTGQFIQNPSLGPATRAVLPQYIRALAQAVQRAMRSRGR
jgi:hypothetical protein